MPWLAIPLLPRTVLQHNEEFSTRRGLLRFDFTRNEMAGRRQSVTAQLSRQARRFSTAIVPQFTKIEPVNILQKIDSIDIKIRDVRQMQRAVDRYILRNTVQFEPIEFDIFDKSGFRLLQASLFPDELVLQEGSKKICSITFGDEDNSEAAVIKVKHPVTGITVYELRELGGIIMIQSNTDELNGTRIMTQSISLAGCLLACGCAFTKEQWGVLREDRILAMIMPQKSFFSENHIKIQWSTNCDNDLRLIALAFGLSQMIKEAFPPLMHIVKEFRTRRG